MKALAELVAEVKRQALLPLDEAVALPVDAYRSEAFLALETERLFRSEWICAGRADRLPNGGDWFCFDLVGEPIIIVRTNDGTIRALSNVCAHRSAQLKSGRGNSQSLQCPYHAWTYDLDGSLRSAPFMDKAKGFNIDDIRLPPLRLEIWQGFIFVNLDPKAEPLAPRLSGLDTQIAAYRISDIQTVVEVEETWEVNWKVALENTMESYHTFRVHPKIDSVLPTRTTVPFPGESAYHVQTMQFARPGLVSSTLFRATIYPSLVIDVGPLPDPRLSWFTSRPIGIARTLICTGYGRSLPPGSTLPDTVVQRAAGENDEINAQDRAVCLRVQSGICSGFAKPGRLSHLEAPLWEFGRYLVRKLT